MDTLAIIEVLVRICWLAGAVAFVLGLARMNSPATARNGNLLSAAGMVLAIGATAVLILARELVGPDPEGVSTIGWAIILVGILLGGGVGLRRARREIRGEVAGPDHAHPVGGHHGLTRPRAGHVAAEVA